MTGETLEPLVYLTSKLRSLEGKLTFAQAKRLVALPRELGFSSTEEFLDAFRAAVSAEQSPRAVESYETDDRPGDAQSAAASNDLPPFAAQAAETEPSAEEVSSIVMEEDPQQRATDEEAVADEAAVTHGDAATSGDAATRAESATEENGSMDEGDADRQEAASDEDVDGAVKQLIEAGKSRAQIARELGISERKVQAVRKSLGMVRKRSAGTGKTKSPSTTPGGGKKRGSAKSDGSPQPE